MKKIPLKEYLQAKIKCCLTVTTAYADVTRGRYWTMQKSDQQSETSRKNAQDAARQISMEKKAS